MASTLEQLQVVQTQVAAAGVGYPALDHKHLPDADMFQQGPTDYGAALRISAYWLAIAARALGDRSLAGHAAGYAASAIPHAVSLSNDGSIKTMLEAANLIRDALAKASAPLPTDPAKHGEAIAAWGQARATADYARSRLVALATPTALQQAQEADDSTLSTLKRALEKFQDQIRKLLTAGAIVGGVVSAAVLVGIAWYVVKRVKGAK